jgi:hypothetical protein
MCRFVSCTAQRLLQPQGIRCIGRKPDQFPVFALMPASRFQYGIDSNEAQSPESLGFWLGDGAVKLKLLQGYYGRCMTQESGKIVPSFHSSFLDQDDANLSEQEISTLFRVANADHGVRSNRGLIPFISRETRSLGPPEERAGLEKHLFEDGHEGLSAAHKMTLRCMMFLRYPT